MMGKQPAAPITDASCGGVWRSGGSDRNQGVRNCHPLTGSSGGQQFDVVARDQSVGRSKETVADPALARGLPFACRQPRMVRNDHRIGDFAQGRAIGLAIGNSQQLDQSTALVRGRDEQRAQQLRAGAMKPTVKLQGRTDAQQVGFVRRGLERFSTRRRTLPDPEPVPAAATRQDKMTSITRLCLGKDRCGSPRDPVLYVARLRAWSP